MISRTGFEPVTKGATILCAATAPTRDNINYIFFFNLKRITFGKINVLPEMIVQVVNYLKLNVANMWW